MGRKMLLLVINNFRGRVNTTWNPMRKSVYLFLFLAFLLLTFSFRKTGTVNYPELVIKQFPAWTAYYKKVNPGFSAADFKIRSEKLFSYELKNELEQEKDTLKTKLYCWSPDHSRFVDIYTYAFSVLIDSGKVTLEGNDPESAIFMGVIKEKKSYRLDFTGSQTAYEDVTWLDNKRFMVTGTEIEGMNLDSLRNFFIVYDPVANMKSYYSGTAFARKADKGSYLTQKVSELIFRK
jgi:hypothetical protein